MMSEKNYKIVFIKSAKKDYQNLDGSIKRMVNIALAKLEDRADELGEPLTNKHGINLTGCRKIKLRHAGIRIVYRIFEVKVDIVEIIAIGKREDLNIYKQASNRLDKY